MKKIAVVTGYSSGIGAAICGELEKNNYEIIELKTRLEEHKNLELEVDESRYFVKGNSTALGILIRNLVDNAVKYTQENGLVTIKILRSDKKIKLIVQDNGPGVAAEFKERIFERFFRVIGSKATGSGLGLSIVKQIVDIHSADIVINDNSEAESGLVVTVSFKSVENKK